MVKHNARTTGASTGVAGTGLTRRKLLALIGGGTAAGFTLGSQTWFRSAFASTEPPGPTVPPQSVPEATPVGPMLPSVDAKAAELEYAVDRIFEFVRDDVSYETYAGALRGSRGALWGLAANSVDQSMLLAELLALSRVPIRFAIGELDEQAASDLLDGTRIDRETTLARLAAPHVAAAAAVGADDLEVTAEMEAQIDRFVAMGERRAQLATQRLQAGIDQLVAALESANVAIAEPDVVLAETEVRRHVWVQYADGPAWIDLDPSFPGEPGVAYATLSETLDHLPDDLFHTVTIRVAVEETAGELVARRTLVEQRVRCVDVVGTTLGLAHMPGQEFAGTGLAITEVLTGTCTLYPTLAIGADAVADQPIRIGKGGGALDALGADDGSDGDAVAEWLEFDLLGPERDPLTVSRVIFDRVDPDRRASGDVLAADVPLPDLIELTEYGLVYPPLLDLRAFAITGSRLPATLAMPTLLEGSPTLDTFGTLAVGYHLLLDAIALTDLAKSGTRLHLDGPNILATTWTVTGAESGDPVIAVEADLVHRSFRVDPVSDVPAAVAPGIAAGVASHVAERMLLDTSWMPEYDVELPSPDRSVGRLFEEAVEQGVALRVLDPRRGDVAAPDDLSAPARVLVGLALDAGLVVIMPESAIDIDGVQSMGWWLVDPATGTVRDQFDNGHETSLVEYAKKLLEFIVKVFPKWRTLGCAVAVGMAMGAAVSGYGSYQQYAAGPSAPGAANQARGGAFQAFLGPVAIAVGCR